MKRLALALAMAMAVVPAPALAGDSPIRVWCLPEWFYGVSCFELWEFRPGETEVVIEGRWFGSALDADPQDRRGFGPWWGWGMFGQGTSGSFLPAGPGPKWVTARWGLYTDEDGVSPPAVITPDHISNLGMFNVAAEQPRPIPAIEVRETACRTELYYDADWESREDAPSHRGLCEIQRVPEPPVAALLATGLLGVAWVRRAYPVRSRRA